MTSEPRWTGPYGDEINRIANLLLERWKEVDPTSSIALNPCSYVATFADIAKAIVDDQNTRAAPEVPDLVRYSVRLDKSHVDAMRVSFDGEYVRHDQAVEVIAEEQSTLRFCESEWSKERGTMIDTIQQERNRAETAEVKLAQINDQKPVGVISKVKMSSLAGLVCNIFNPLDGDFEVPDGLKLYAAPVASDAETIERCARLVDRYPLLSQVAAAIRALSGKEPA